MVERVDKDRQKLVCEYRVVYEEIPQLKELALGYWQSIKNLSPDDIDAVSKENSIFNRTVLDLSNILLNNQSFQKAMLISGADPEENAIIESIFMIETVFDDQEEDNNNEQ